MKKKVVVLSSDTTHHRYFINFLIQKGIEFDSIIFETQHVNAPFAVSPFFEDKEEHFEKSNFFININYSLPENLVVDVETVNSSKAIEIFDTLKPDIGIVFGTGKINKKVLGMFKDGLINVHRGIAQYYRGLDSDLWAIYHRDYKNIGVTIHMVDSELDTGEILYQENILMHKGMKTHQLRYYTTKIATDLIYKSILDYFSSGFKSYPQEKRGRYYSFMPLVLKRIVNKRFNSFCENL
ncbi:MAG: formyl transferase [Candidatus Marinimicrobia bacterium]|nr:formyl transferase [Candidatus Neomarinimicrobiota bacterium]|tara:strand:- start:1702 stop:2415 length:714 start_codon:yes stop_codon:yes gene_type:complete